MLTGEILGASAARDPDKTALLWNEARVSYGALDAAANRFAHALIGAGIAPGDTVAILCGNRPEYAAAYFGIARAGAVSAHLSPRYLAEEIRHTMALVGARAVVVEAPLAMTLAALGDTLADLKTAIVVGGEGPGIPYESFVAGMPASDPGLDIDPDKPASITFTGGTTGFPKAALVSHAGRSHWARVAINDFGLDEDEVGIVAAPLYHAAGGFIWFQPIILAGGTCVLQGHWDVPEFIAAVERRGGTGAFLVPAQISMLLDDPSFDAGRLASLRKVIYGAAPSPPPLIARAEAALPDVEFIQNFGQSETGPLITCCPRDRRDKPEALGYPSPLVEVGIFTAPGVPAAPGEIGEICARGVNVMRGYFGEDAETSEFFRGADGWGWTGDLAYADADGLITLVDRAKDMIISGGVNIYPAEIEKVLAAHPDIDDCAAFGIADDRWGELPAAAVVLAPGAAAGVDEILGFLEGRIARHKRPRRIMLTEALPRSAAGKVLRNVLRESCAAPVAGGTE